MENKMQIFSNPAFGNVRTIEEDGKVLFCAKDIAKNLGYIDTTNAIKSHCRGVVKRHLPTDSGIQELNVIPEGDVYRLITRSKLPAAEKFERWVFDDVVPCVVKSGQYGQTTIDVETITKIATIVCSEMIKQLLPLFSNVPQALPEVQDGLEFPDETKRFKNPVSIISKLSPELRQELEEMLCSGNYTYTDVVDRLSTYGIKVSTMSVCRYKYRNGCHAKYGR